MIRSFNLLKNQFSRSRRRREYSYDPKLKDLSRTQFIQQQIGIHRQKFESKIPEKTLLQTLNDPKPKLDKRFMVDNTDINKKLKTIIKKQLKLDRIQSGQDNQTIQDMIGDNQQKSFIFNQHQEMQFQQKFKKQLFKKKEVNRLIQKEKNDYRNYLQQPKDLKYLQYEENKNKLKNNRIQSMMNYQKNNEQLRLLIDSGYIDHPENVIKIMNEANPIAQLMQGKNQEQEKQIESNASRQEKYVEYDATGQRQVSVNQIDGQIIQNTIHSELMRKIEGPEQLRDKHKLQQFFQKYQESSQLQKQRTKKDLDLLYMIKQYEEQKFISRYDDINFRFKGQVDFTFMKQNELLSYIKTEKSERVYPENLIKIYTQNKESLNKFNKPIITPTVMGRIYSSCSLFLFPQDLQNNRINMLRDNGFVDLQRNLFKNLQKLSNQHFSDSVFAYTKNHQQQQGLLKNKMHQRVVQKILNQLQQRIFLLNEQDLGLILRSLTKLNIFQNQKHNWNQIADGLSQRISQIQQSYQFESTVQFLTLLPVSSTTIESIYKNIQKWKAYKWEAKETLMSFSRGSAFLIRHSNLIPTYLRIRTMQQLKHVILVKQKQIKQILPQISINNYPQILTVFGHLSACRPKNAEYEINIPQILINVSKKQITDNIHMQKQLVMKPTIGNISMALSLLDYQNALVGNQDFSYDVIPVMQVSALKSLFSFRPFTYNSSLYFIYHELAKLTNAEIAHLPVKSIVQTLFANSLVRFKNQGIFDEIVQRLLQKIQNQARDYQEKQRVHQRYFKQYIMIINSFHHNRRLSQNYYYFLNLIQEHGLQKIISVTPHTLIRFFQSIVSLSFTNMKQTQDYIIIQKYLPVLQLVLKHSIVDHLDSFLKEELICLKFTISLFSVFETQKKKNLKLFQETIQKINNRLLNFQTSFQETYLIALVNQMVDMSSRISSQVPQFSTKFLQVEKEYYKKLVKRLQEEEQHIGTQFSYQLVISKIKSKLIKQGVQFIEYPWRIQLKQEKTVYFFATYEHLAAKYENKKVGVRLFGLWKIYSQIFNKKGWKFNLVCTFLEG